MSFENLLRTLCLLPKPALISEIRGKDFVRDYLAGFREINKEEVRKGVIKMSFFLVEDSKFVEPNLRSFQDRNRFAHLEYQHFKDAEKEVLTSEGSFSLLTKIDEELPRFVERKKSDSRYQEPSHLYLIRTVLYEIAA